MATALSSNSSDKKVLTCDLLNIQESVQRAKEEGLPITEYTLRKAIHTGHLPCRIVGRTYLIYWNNLLSWLTCSDSSDNSVKCAN